MFNAKIVDNFISKENCSYLIKKAIELNAWEGAGHEFWDGRVVNHNRFLSYDKDAANILLDANVRCKEIIKKEYSLSKPIYSDILQVVRWFPGMSQPPHADDMSDTNNTNHRHRVFGSVIYLNNEYTGGQTYYSNFDIKILPKVGSLALHPADPEHSHGVTEVGEDIRYTIASFWTFNPDYAGLWNV